MAISRFKRFDKYEPTRPAATASPPVSSRFVRLRRLWHQIESDQFKLERKRNLEDFDNARFALWDASCAYELMNQVATDDRDELERYTAEFDFMARECIRWISGEKAESYSASDGPYSIVYGEPWLYTPEALARPGGQEAARASAATYQRLQQGLYDGILRSNERYERLRQNRLGRFAVDTGPVLAALLAIGATAVILELAC